MEDLSELLRRALAHVIVWRAEAGLASDLTARLEAEARVKFYEDLIAELRAVIANGE